MPMCRLPGCVAQAVQGGVLCPVHLSGAGRLCEQCHGQGVFHYIGQRETMTCLACGGTGLADKHVSAPKPKKGSDPVDKRGLIALGED